MFTSTRWKLCRITIAMFAMVNRNGQKVNKIKHVIDDDYIY